MLDEQRTQAGAEPLLRETDGLAMAPNRTVPSGSAPAEVMPLPAAPLPAAPVPAAPVPAAPLPAAPVPAAPVPARGPAGAYTDPVTWVIALAVFGAYTAISLSRLMQLNPTSWDLGIYTEDVKQAAHLAAPVVDIRGVGFNLFGDHFQPIVAVIAPFFRVFPSAATLLVAQALLAALSVFPVSQMAREKLGLGPGRAIAVAYGFSWGLQQMVDYDFHEIAFAVPLLAFSLSALLRGRLRAAVWWTVPLVFVKEDQGFTVVAIGLYLIVTGLRAKTPGIVEADGRRRIRAGLLLLIWGFAWSFLAIGVIIPHFNPAHHYDYWSDGGVLAPGGHLTAAGLIGQLFHAWPDKLQTTVLLLLPTVFIALRSPLALIAVPSLLLRFLSTDSSFWGTVWHYNATVMPVIFIAAVDALVRIRAATAADDPAGITSWASGRRGPRRAILAGAQRHGAAMMLAIAVALAFQFPLSHLWDAQTYRISPHVEAAEAAMAQVPDGATVQATLDFLAPLAARTDTFWIGNAGNPRTQYIVFDGLDSDYSPAISNVPAFIAKLYPHDAYVEVFESGDVYVFQRSS
jgi:uncharacterized membrane protein